MSTSVENTLKLAHDALRIVRFCVPPAQRPTVEKAMQALEEALSSPNGEAQPEQEPVGFYDARGNDICIEIPMGESGDWWQPVYTAPPQRTAAVGEDTRKAWVGLTDEQIEAIAEEFGVGGWICDFARAIEAEPKEENDC